MTPDEMYEEENEDDVEDDINDFDKNKLSVEVGIEFEGLHNITLCTDVEIHLDKPVNAVRRLQSIIEMLKKAIPTSEYLEKDLSLGPNGEIHVHDPEPEEN